MASPSTRETLKQYCLRNLGKPVIDINVDDDQVEDRLDEALQYFAQYHSDGIERMYLKYKVTADDVTRLTTNTSYNVDEKGTSHTNIELEDASGDIVQQDGSAILTEDSTLVVDGFSLNSNVDGETMRLSDINGTNSSQNHKISWAFPTEIWKFKTGSILMEGSDSIGTDENDQIILQDATDSTSTIFGIGLEYDNQ